MKPRLLFFLMLFYGLAQGQPEQYNWYLGGIYGISFANGRQILMPHPNKDKEDFRNGYTASVSDPISGAFLFQANGNRILDRNFDLMPGANMADSALYTLIVPNRDKKGEYLVFYSIGNSVFFTVVDMDRRDGLGELVSSSTLVSTGVMANFTLVEDANQNSQLITHAQNGNEYRVFSIYGKDILGSTSFNAGGNVHIGSRLDGMIISNRSGTVFALSAVFTGSQNQSRIELVKFKKCLLGMEHIGTLRTEITGPGEPGLAQIAFSPTDRYLFASTMGTDAQGNCYQEIWRYDLQAADPNQTRTSLAKFNAVPGKTGSIALAPDGKIYVNCWELADGKLHFSVIHDPEGPGISFEHNAFSLTGFNPPSQTWRVPFPQYEVDTFFMLKANWTFTYGCWGDSAYFSFDEKYLFYFDSFYWDMGDGRISHDIKGSHMYTAKGDYQARFVYWDCGRTDWNWGASYCDVRMQDKPVSNLRGDTTVCAGADLRLTAEKGITEYLWSTGDTNWTITVDKPGRYWVRSRNGTCITYDSMDLSYYPPIWVELGGEHYLCEDDSETVILDAGHGFVSYLWNPTKDSSQWLIVRRVGDYYVIVEDFHGCSGEDGTRVERRCDYLMEIPNAFSPNGDGLNDVFAPVSQDLVSFSLTLYDRWGERIYVTEDPGAGWNGTYKDEPAPIGVYYYHLAYTGYIKQRLRKRTESGVVHLLR